MPMYPLIHPFNIPTFGLFLLGGIGLAFLLTLVTAKRYPIAPMDAMFFGLSALIGGLIGAKVLFFIVNLPAFFTDPLTTLFSLLNGGAVFYGGLIGGIGSGYFYTKIYQLKAIIFFDITVPGLALAQACGRIGCFFNGCCYGIPDNGPLAVIYPQGAYPPAGIGLFPTQLVESLFLFLLSGLLVVILQKSRVEGRASGFYLLLYGVFRFLIEFLRGDPRGSIFIFSTSQFLSIFIIVSGLLFLIPHERLKNKADI